MQGRKKVLYVVTKSNWGGAQRYVYDLATHLPKDKYSVAVATGGNGPLINKLDRASINTFILPSLERDINLRKEIKSLFELFQLIRATKPDVLHVNSSKTGGLGAFIGWLLGTSNIVFTAHGWPFKEVRPLWQTVLIKFFSWLTVIFSDTTIVVSDDDYRQSQWMPFVQKQIARVHVGLELTQPFDKTASKKALLSHFNKPDHYNTKTLIIGTISELTPNKGLTYLIEACRTLKSAHENFVCVIIGDGELRDSLQKEINELDLQHNVFLTGFVSDAANLIPAFDIFTLTSIKEGLPYTLLEAGLAGNSVIASRVGGIPEIITNGLSGSLTPPQNVPEIARTLVDISQDSKKRAAFGSALKQTVRERFSLQEMLTNTTSLY